jgi:hypothetical protein
MMSAERSQCHFGDAERLKRAFAYFLHQFSKRSWKRFLRSARAVLEHHFNSHRYCDDWCPAKRWKKEDRLKNALKYRSKTLNPELYKEFKSHHDKYTSEEALRDMYHQFHSNKCESLNGNITKYVPKHKMYCRTLTNKGRTHTAIGVDSIGYVAYYHRLFGVLGIETTPTTTANHSDLDHRRRTEREYNKITSIKVRRAQQKSDKINEGRTLTTRDNIRGFAYAKGMGGPLGAVDVDGVGPMQKKAPAQQSVCPYCDQKGHKTTKSKACLYSTVPSSVHYRENNSERPAKGVVGPLGAENVDGGSSPPTATKQSICPYCGKKGHKTNNSKACLFSIVTASPHYREDNSERATGKLRENPTAACD